MKGCLEWYVGEWLLAVYHRKRSSGPMGKMDNWETGGSLDSHLQQVWRRGGREVSNRCFWGLVGLRGVFPPLLHLRLVGKSMCIWGLSLRTGVERIRAAEIMLRGAPKLRRPESMKTTTGRRSFLRDSFRRRRFRRRRSPCNRL